MPFFDFSQGPGIENYGWSVLSGDPAMQYFVVFPDESLSGHTQRGGTPKRNGTYSRQHSGGLQPRIRGEFLLLGLPPSDHVDSVAPVHPEC